MKRNTETGRKKIIDVPMCTGVRCRMLANAGLILEGGGMKGIDTAGVLDAFMEKGIEFSSCYGVSAGASVLCSYMSAQPERSYHIFVDYLDSRDYCSIHSLLTSGDLFGAYMSYDLIPNYLNPFDYDRAAQYPGRCYAVATDIRTGKPRYFRINDVKKSMKAIQASCSLPLVSRNVMIGGEPYLDGGLSDSIPVRRSIADGNKKNVVIMNKEIGYIRQPSENQQLIRIRYAAYPKVYECIKERAINYNSTVDFIEEEEMKGNMFVIRPAVSLDVDRIEKNPQKLQSMYEAGKSDGEARYDAMKAYLES